MTIVVTRNVAPRFRGFLASCMLEIAPGVYTSPSMTRAVRDRVWTILNDWFDLFNDADASIVMTWPDKTKPGRQDFDFLGVPPKQLADLDGVLVVHRLGVQAVD